MKLRAFSGRNRKELLRDPLSLIFGLGLPVFLLLMISFIQKGAQVSIFEINVFLPGISVFSFAFIALFSGILITKDRSDSFLMRLLASPLTEVDFILGYTIPLIPLALAQAVILFGMGLLFGLSFSINLLWAILALIPTILLFIGFGLLFGSSFNDKQLGGIFTIFVNLAAFTSGMWFDMSLVGGIMEKVCYALPFAHAVDAAKAALNGSFSELYPHLLVVFLYLILVYGAAVAIFRKRTRTDNKA